MEKLHKLGFSFDVEGFMEFESDNMIIILAVVFPLLFLLASLILDAGICIILPLIVWVGVAVIMLYIPMTNDE